MPVSTRRNRLLVVLMIPALLLGSWLAIDGVGKLMPSYYHATCSGGKCTSIQSDQPVNATTGIYLGNPFAGGARLEGNLAAWIVLHGSDDRTFLDVPSHRVEQSPCYLTYSEKLERQEFIDSALQTVATIKNVFQLECGTASVTNFRFADEGLQIALVDQLISNDENRSAFNQRQERLSVVAFFAPLVALALLWGCLAIVSRLYRYVWFGRKAVDLPQS